MRVRDFDTAFTLASAIDYGLSANIWIRNAALASAIATRLQVGTIMVNLAVVNISILNLPHGGVKASGVSRSHGGKGCSSV